MYMYIYIFDYVSADLYFIPIKSGDKRDIDDIIVDAGFDLDDINYMVSENELDAIEVEY